MKWIRKRATARAVLLALILVLVFLISSVATGKEPARTQSPENGAAAAGEVPSTGPRQEGIGQGIDRLARETGAQVRTNRATGAAAFARGVEGKPLWSARGASPQVTSAAFLQNYGRAFGVRNARAELALLQTQTDRLGMKHLTYRQSYQGVDVFGGILIVHLDKDNNVTTVNGALVPDIAVNSTPQLTEADAAALAIADVSAHPLADGGPADATGTASRAELKVVSNKLYVYRDGLLQGVPGPTYLVYEVLVSNGGNVREYVYVDAHSGKIVNRISDIESDLHRVLYEESTDNQVWEEGDDFPGDLNEDQQNIVNYSGDSYYFFFNAFGWDSYDNAGAFMQSVNNDPRISCPNANWNGITTNYCNGVTSDDVVAHEWGHAYTDFTHNLIYQWQSGALNESYSDIWGETVDLLNGAGTDAPDTQRSVNVCSTFTTPLVTLTVNEPASIAGDYAAAGAAFGPTLDQTGVTGDLVLADDGSGTTTDACEPLANDSEISGNIALVDRGTCAFTVKVKNAQNAGATGVIVANNVIGAPFTMGGADPSITIPSIMVSQGTGALLRDELPGVNVTMHLAGAMTEDSYRWLQGEDATAFGGAIRDLWAPTCLGDPGKVSDDQYHCVASDAGGVHTNSGVPNHGYALLVDGGTYNGQTINALGLVKAAHIYWRAQFYQSPTSNFADHADALESACGDLIGVELEGLSTESTPAGPSGESITAADCAEVSDMIAAVELRTEPLQCQFEPLLQPDAPELCADVSSEAATIQLYDFEAGLDDWALSNQGVFDGWPNYDWMQATSLPGGRLGAAAFGIDPSAGNCDGGAGDVSGVMHMDSEPIEITEGTMIAPRLAFDHYVATEAGWDGGNLKISVNGGPFTVVPPSAFTFNAYNTTLNSAAAGNTNPLAGQPGFSGTDGGSLFGSWGQSQIDLTRLGVIPGDTIRLRYDMGIDGCTGNDGWYVDDVNVYSCSVTPPDCSGAYASPDMLWPPNHTFRAIQVLGATDPSGETPQIVIRSVFQDEPVLAPDSGHTSPDGMGVGTDTALVRAERVESGNGRVYHIEFVARNTQGGTCTGTVTVGVPVGRRDTPIDDGALYDSTQP